MVFQFFVISLQCAALAAFLILWYFWIKKKMETSFYLDDEENVLFPFRYFSWILLGAILVTCVAQIHFVRVSASVHERLAAVVTSLKKHDQHTKTIEDLRKAIDRLAADMDSVSKVAMMSASGANGNAECGGLSGPKITEPVGDKKVIPIPEKESALVTAQVSKTDAGRNFAREAKASAASVKPSPSIEVADSTENDDEKVYTMRLSRTAHSTIDNLRVRKAPQITAPIIDKLTSGLEVKVTEKRLVTDGVWFKIIMPSGKVGWVDYRYLKLGDNT